MTSLAPDLTAALVLASSNLTAQDTEAGIRLFGSTIGLETLAITASVVGALALALFVWFLIRGECWDQRRFRLWPRSLPGGIGRREGDHPFFQGALRQKQL